MCDLPSDRVDLNDMMPGLDFVGASNGDARSERAEEHLARESARCASAKVHLREPRALQPGQNRFFHRRVQLDWLSPPQEP
jgi:hypothetical protein